MDEILYKASNQAMSFAIKSGISIASGYAIKTMSKLMEKLPDTDTKNIFRKRKRISTKINIISSSIEIIRLISAQGNSSLLSTVALIDELEESIEKFDNEVGEMIKNLENNNNNISTNGKEAIVKKVEKLMNELIEEIDESVPLINLSLITCGVNREGISLSKLIKALNYLETNSSNKVDKTQEMDGEERQEFIENIIGPKFTFKFYSVFYNPSRLENGGSKLDCISWKEKFAKCSVTINKIKSSTYKLKIIEDFNDDRYHDEEDEPEVKEIKLSEISKMFFTSSGKILRLDSKLPVLILKVGEDYVGFGISTLDDTVSDSEEENENENENVNENDEDKEEINKDDGKKVKGLDIEGDKDLSLLEYLLKLVKLQETENKSISLITDEKLGIYLSNKNNEEMESNILKLSNLKI